MAEETKEQTKLKVLRIKGADGTAIEIGKGDYYINTKARARRMMLNSLSADARRAYSCLELATMGFRQELAVIQIGKDKRRPLTPGDIRQQTGLIRQHVTRALKELEDAGLVQRKAPDGGALRKGQVLIYSWAVPREPKSNIVTARGYNLPSWFPDSWEPFKPFINRFKLRLAEDFVTARDLIEEGAEIARKYKEAEIVAARFLNCICAGAKNAPHKRKKEKIDERNPPSSSAFSVETAHSGKKAEEEEGGSLYQKFKAQYPAAHYDEAKAKPCFERKSKTQQALILERLHVYLTCDRWVDEGGRWIPLASKWLESYEADPPPVLVKVIKSKSAAAAGTLEERARRIAANVEESRKWR